MMCYAVLDSLGFGPGFHSSMGTPENSDTYIICPRGVKFQQYEGKKCKQKLHPIRHIDLHIKKSAVEGSTYTFRDHTPIPPISAFRDIDEGPHISMKQLSVEFAGE